MVDKKTILEVLAKMQEYFGRKITPEVQKIYVEQLERMEYKDFTASSVRIMQEFDPTSTKPFPLIADFIKMSGQDSETKAVNVVAFLRRKLAQAGQYQSVDLGDRVLHGVIQRYGGWAEMVLNNYDEWWSLHERNFILAYKSAERAGIEGPEYLQGIHEIENTKNGFTPDKLKKLGLSPTVAGFIEKDKKVLGIAKAVPE